MTKASKTAKRPPQAASPAKAAVKRQIVCQNRKAKFEIAIEDEHEAGLVLSGSEVKSLRAGRAHLSEAYVQVVRGQVMLINGHIGEYANASHFGHAPTRSRRLLLHRREIDKLAVRLGPDGYTAVPLALYFNERGLAKLSFGVGRGKGHADKRQDLKAKDAARDVSRALRRGQGR